MGSQPAPKEDVVELGEIHRIPQVMPEVILWPSLSWGMREQRLVFWPRKMPVLPYPISICSLGKVAICTLGSNLSLSAGVKVTENLSWKILTLIFPLLQLLMCMQNVTKTLPCKSGYISLLELHKCKWLCKCQAREAPGPKFSKGIPVMPPFRKVPQGLISL